MPTTSMSLGAALIGLALVPCGAAPAAQSPQSVLRGQVFAGPTDPPPAPTFVAPNDPGLVYTEYVDATVGPLRASFARPTVPGLGDDHSPGTRIGFATDATRVVMRVDYLETFATPGAGRFRLEVDCELLPRPFGSDTDLGPNTYVLLEQDHPRRRELSLILPYGSDVDFLGLELTGGSPGLLSPPPPRPPFLHVAYGDSITHGFEASSVAEGYPHLVSCLLEERVINMGFTGRTVNAADGTAVGALGGDRVTLAIGVNDHAAETPAAAFQASYEALLDSVRSLQPAVPLYAVTPTWVAWDDTPNGQGLTVEDYRQLVRDVVLPRTASDPELHLIEGSTLIPLGQSYFADGIHPNDAGFAFYATTLGGPNLVANPGAETDRFAWQESGEAEASTASPNTGLKALHVGPGSGKHEQPVGRVRRGESYVLSAWSRVGAPGDTGALGISFYDPAGVELAREEVQVDWTVYQQSSVPLTTPAQFAYATVWCSKGAGPSNLYVDDFELLEAGQAFAEAYGAGTVGALGVPALVARDEPRASGSVALSFENVAGFPTVGLLRLARGDARERARADVFLARAAATSPVLVPRAGLDLVLCLDGFAAGERLLLQGVHWDPAARGGLAASPLLSLVLGAEE